MSRKSILFFTLLFVLTLSAQAIPPLKIARTVVNSAANSVVTRSARANRFANAQIRKFAKRAAAPREQNVSLLASAHRFRNTVFEVQISDFGHNTASAFALNVQGHIWGVTAAHVMKNISADPVIKIKKGTETITARISSWHIGNKAGNDVAIFEIPSEVLPHIQVLSPETKTLLPDTETQSPSFVRGHYTFLPSEDVLFAGPHRILLRDQLRREATGYCGSPVLVDGKVVGLHVGAYSLEHVQTAAWNFLLNSQHLSVETPIHVASPIQNVLHLAQEVHPIKAENSTGIMLKVLGHPIRAMRAQEHLHSIVLLRNGFVQKKIHTHPFMNFEKLEEFFELEENDILRITIESPKKYDPSMITQIYDINVSTGEVTQLGQQ